MNADRAFGLDYVLRQVWGGQWSRAYRLHCRLGVTHRTDRSARLQPREEWSEARRWAAHYFRLWRRKAAMFQ